MLGRTGHLFRRLGSAGTVHARLFSFTSANLGPPAASTTTQPKAKWKMSYLRMSVPLAEKILGIQLHEIDMVPLNEMLARGEGISVQTMDDIKKRVYDRIVEYLNINGPIASPHHKHANIDDLILYIIGPIIDAVCKMGGRKIRLRRQMELFSVDGMTGGLGEFVLVDQIAGGKDNVVVVIQPKNTLVGQVMKLAWLTLKAARDSNNEGIVYGFVTTGLQWKMLSYDGVSFRSTPNFTVVLNEMEEYKTPWVKEGSLIVDCMVAALMNGGIMRKANC